MGKEKRLLLLAVMILGIQTGSYGEQYRNKTVKEKVNIPNLTSGNGVSLIAGNEQKTDVTLVEGSVIKVNGGKGIQYNIYSKAKGTNKVTNNGQIIVNKGIGADLYAKSDILEGSKNEFYNGSETAEGTITVLGGTGIVLNSKNGHMINETKGIITVSGGIGISINNLSSTVENKGEIIVDGVKGTKGIELKGGTVTNNGTIKVENTGIGIELNGSKAVFNNSSENGKGMIKISNGVGIVQKSGAFNNKENSEIKITGGKGFHVEGGEVINDGTIDINSVTGLQLKGANVKYTNNRIMKIAGKGTGVIVSEGRTDKKSVFINNSNATIEVQEGSKGFTVEKGKAENLGTVTATGKNAAGIYMNGVSGEFDNKGTVVASGADAKGVQFGFGSGTMTNDGTIKATNGALGVFFYQGKNNKLVNSGTIDAENGTAIESGKDTNNTVTLQDGSEIIGKIKGNNGIDVLALEGGTHSDLNVTDYEKIVAKSGDSKIQDSTISLGFNSGTDNFVSQNVGTANGSVTIADSKLIIDLSNKKDSTGLVAGQTTLDGNMKLSFIADNQRKFNISEILNENIQTGANLSLGDSAVWSYTRDENGKLIAEKKEYNNAVGKSQLSDFAKVLDENEKTASGEFKKGMAVLSMLNEPEFTDAMTQISGGVHAYTADFAAINSRTLSETMKNRILREDKTRGKAVSSYEQDVIYIDKDHKIGGLMDVDYEENGILAVTEKQLLQNGRVGLVYGGTKGKAEFENGKHGEAKMDNIYLGGYYDHEFSDKVSLLTNMNFVYSHTDVTRNVNLEKYDKTLKDYSYKSTYPVFGFGMGTKLLYTLYDNDNDKLTVYGGIDWTKVVQGNINENSDKPEDSSDKNLTIKNIPADEQMYDSVVPNVGLAVQHNGYIFDRKYRVGADISYETELGNIKDEKKLKLSALKKHHRVTTTERENILSYSLNGALDLTDDFTIYADYTKTSSDEYEAGRIGAGFEYRMDRMSDIFVTGPMLGEIENSRLYSKRWSGVWSVMLDGEDDTDRSYYTDVLKEHTRGDYATSLKLKPKMTLSLNDRDTKWSYYFETYYMQNGMGMNLDENERRKGEARIHGEARWTDQYSKGKYGINFGYRNETSSAPTLSRHEENTLESRLKRGTHQLRITPNLTYNLGNGFVFGGSTTLIAAYDYRGYRDGQTDLEMENEWGITYNGFMPRWRFTVNYFREETWYDKDFTKPGRVKIGNDYVFKDVEGESRYQSNQLRPTITYFFGNGARLVLNARIPLGNGAWHNSDDGDKKTAEKYETRYGVKYYQPITPGFTGFIGGEILTTKTKTTDHGVNHGKETRDYSIRPTVGFSYSF